MIVDARKVSAGAKPERNGRAVQTLHFIRLDVGELQCELRFRVHSAGEGRDARQPNRKYYSRFSNATTDATTVNSLERNAGQRSPLSRIGVVSDGGNAGIQKVKEQLNGGAVVMVR